MSLIVLWIMTQIIMESLPVSSSGHVALLLGIGKIYGLDNQFLEHAWVVDFLLHGPTVIILSIYFVHDWWNMVFVKPNNIRVLCTLQGLYSIARALWFVGIVDGITFAFWWLDIWPKFPLYIGFSITAMLLYGTKYFESRDKEFDCNWKHAVLLGITQGFSLIPGISRFASTYCMSKVLGYKNKIAFYLSFMAQFPLILGGFCKGMFACYKSKDYLIHLCTLKNLFVVFIASVVSFGMLYFVEKMINKKKLWYISWYMIVPILLSLFI